VTTHTESQSDLALTLTAKLFRGFSDSSRLALLEALRAGPLCVSELVEATGLSQPNVSNHLNCLYDCGLVLRRPQGRCIYYRLRDDRVASLLSVAESLLGDVAQGIYECTRYDAQTRTPDE
jgi:ArsR family transcriptional regulator, cadmium/lead-responsive transcriptional repressor